MTPHYQTLKGELQLSFYKQGKKTRMTSCYQRSPLKASRTLYPSGNERASVYLVDTSGGIACGDYNQIVITADHQASVDIIQQSATKIYPARIRDKKSKQDISIIVSNGSQLYWHPETTIPFAGSRFQQSVTIRVDASSCCYFADILSPGREKYQEIFQYESIDSTLHVYYEGKRLAYDRLYFQPSSQEMLGLLDDYYFGSAWYIASCIPRDLAMIQQADAVDPNVRFAVTALDPIGLHARWLSRDLCLLKEQMQYFQALVCAD
ncbi:urease accessory protein UreD [Gracilibacillus alcaliphilus]|uniref:urease accessory protein UreD n=1 Tax=Gracilibacillus alcaliphilus TaxID=1401441 RepID=UPI00195DC4B9|nr:urease accessory protein UreD [Gracilibacillus alcaliphilus]MBM7677503.1 urease accessory protein [Gracilibacillus alcaliphilus]